MDFIYSPLFRGLVVLGLFGIGFLKPEWGTGVLLGLATLLVYLATVAEERALARVRKLERELGYVERSHTALSKLSALRRHRSHDRSR